jgi:hypothetical protein
VSDILDEFARYGMVRRRFLQVAGLLCAGGLILPMSSSLPGRLPESQVAPIHAREEWLGGY